MGPLWSSTEKKEEKPQTVEKPPAPIIRLTDKNWREILKEDSDWEEPAVIKFKDEVKKRFGATETVKKANILLLGPVGSGKSSFANSILSISKERIANKAQAGSAEKSYTTKYGQYADQHMFQNFILHDSMGVEPTDGEGFHVNDVVHMMEGHVPKNYKFNPRNPISEDDEQFKKDTSDEDKVHCVIFFIDSSTFEGDLPKKLISKIAELQDKIKELEVPRLLVLTKIDLLCPEVQKDLTKTFKSIKVRNMVDKAAEIFKLPRSNIHPVKNYESEVNTDSKVDALLLYPLRQALDFATDHLED